MAVKSLSPRRVKRTNLEYITDNNGKKTKVVMPIEDYENLLEDLFDLSVIAGRKNEKLVPFQKVISGLKKDGKI